MALAPYVAVRSVVSAVTTLPWLYSNTDLSCGLVGTFCSTAVKTTPRPVLERSFRSTDVKRPGDEVDFPVHRDLLVLLFARR